MPKIGQKSEDTFWSQPHVQPSTPPPVVGHRLPVIGHGGIGFLRLFKNFRVLFSKGVPRAVPVSNEVQSVKSKSHKTFVSNGQFSSDAKSHFSSRIWHALLTFSALICFLSWIKICQPHMIHKVFLVLTGDTQVFFW